VSYTADLCHGPAFQPVALPSTSITEVLNVWGVPPLLQLLAKELGALQRELLGLEVLRRAGRKLRGGDEPVVHVLQDVGEVGEENPELGTVPVVNAPVGDEQLTLDRCRQPGHGLRGLTGQPALGLQPRDGGLPHAPRPDGGWRGRAAAGRVQAGAPTLRLLPLQGDKKRQQQGPRVLIVRGAMRA
jgi:hypothetical protein